MIKKLLVIVTGILLIGINAFAADGDFIVEGNVGIGSATPMTDYEGTLYIRGDRTNGEYVSLIIGQGDNSGSGIFGKRDNGNLFMTFAGWDNVYSESIEMYYGGGGWGAVDANVHKWFVDPVYSGVDGIVNGGGNTPRMQLDNNNLSLSTNLVIDNTHNVGIGTATPQATLDINGYAKLKKYATEPVQCESTKDGSIALTSSYRMCACNGTSWVDTSNGSTCSW